MQFSGVLQTGSDGRGCAVALPDDPRTELGRARAPVVVTVVGFPPFRTTVAIYGGVGWIGFRKDQLASMGLAAGDPVAVTVVPDPTPRSVSPPAELAAALAAEPELAAAFRRLSFSHQREYARWVGEAKRSETRLRRAAQTLDQLRARTAP